jgi:hypothetical protein
LLLFFKNKISQSRLNVYLKFYKNSAMDNKLG